jgi:hypothetical protein
VGWVLVQSAAAVLLLLRDFGPELQPAVVQVLTLLFSLAFGVGLVYFVTGMCLSCAVPAESGARRLAWGIVGCLIVSAAAWLLFNGAVAQNQEIVQEIVAKINQAQKENPKAGPPSKAELESELERQWGQDTLKALLATAVGAFCLGKIVFTVVLRQVARHFRQEWLAGGLMIYLLAEGLGAAMVVTVFLRLPPTQGLNSPLALFTGGWPSVLVVSAFCSWFLVYLFLVRRAISRALPSQ